MTKIFNFALKIKGDGREGGTCEVLRPCHPPQKNLEGAPTPRLAPLASAVFVQVICGAVVRLPFECMEVKMQA